MQTEQVGELPHDAKLLQVTERFVDRGRSNAGLCHQPARGSNGPLHQRLVDLQSGRRRPAKASDSVPILIPQVEKLLGRFHCLGGGKAWAFSPTVDMVTYFSLELSFHIAFLEAKIRFVLILA